MSAISLTLLCASFLSPSLCADAKLDTPASVLALRQALMSDDWQKRVHGIMDASDTLLENPLPEVAVCDGISECLLQVVQADPNSVVRMFAAMHLPHFIRGASGVTRENVVRGLVSALPKSDESACQEIVQALISSREATKDCLPTLRELAKTSISFHRFRIAQVILTFDRKDFTALAVFRGGLNAPDKATRMFAMEVLRDLGSKGSYASSSVVRLLSGPDTELREAAARTLGELCATDEASVSALASALRDRERSVRKAAALALHRLDPDDDRPTVAMIEVLNDKNVSGRLAAVGEMTWIAGQPLIRGYISATDREDLASAWQQFRDSNQEARVKAATVLGRIGPPARAAIPALEQARKDPDSKMCEAAERALRYIRKKG